MVRHSSMARQNGVQEKLFSVLTETRLRNPSYSMRAFARKLGISSSALSEILSGKRNVSYRMGERLLVQLGVDETEKNALLSSGESQDQKRSEKNQKAFQIGLDQVRFLAEWYHFAILALVEVAGFRPDPEWISKKLGIGRSVAQSAWERLLRLGLLRQKNPEGDFVLTHHSWETPDHVADQSLRRSHADGLELAARSLLEDSIEERDFTSMTMAVNSERLPEARKLIRKFHQKMSELMESGERNEVYRFSVHLYPLTRERVTRKKESPL